MIHFSLKEDDGALIMYRPIPAIIHTRFFVIFLFYFGSGHGFALPSHLGRLQSLSSGCCAPSRSVCVCPRCCARAYLAIADKGRAWAGWEKWRNEGKGQLRESDMKHWHETWGRKPGRARVSFVFPFLLDWDESMASRDRRPHQKWPCWASFLSSFWLVIFFFFFFILTDLLYLTSRYKVSISDIIHIHFTGWTLKLPLVVALLFIRIWFIAVRCLIFFFCCCCCCCCCEDVGERSWGKAMGAADGSSGPCASVSFLK